MDPVKISGVRDWQSPSSVKDVRSFLGFCNFYRQFIRGFANIAKPLNELTRKDEPWQWRTRHQTAFDTLKQRVTTEPILAHADQTQQFDLEVDASGFAVGAVLLQKKQDGKRHPVGYYSATLNAAERNYDIYNLELLAIVKALRNWRHLLAGSPHKVRIFSDHLNLRYWRDPQKISRRIAREVLELAEYNFEIHHVKGNSQWKSRCTITTTRLRPRRKGQRRRHGPTKQTVRTNNQNHKTTGRTKNTQVGRPPQTNQSRRTLVVPRTKTGRHRDQWRKSEK